MATTPIAMKAAAIPSMIAWPGDGEMISDRDAIKAIPALRSISMIPARPMRNRIGANLSTANIIMGYI